MDGLAKPRVQAEPVVTTTDAPVSRTSTNVGDKVNTDLFITLDRDIPFSADYFGVGDMLSYKDLPYKEEVDAIDEYLIDEVKSKRLENSTQAVKARMKELEKLAGIRPLTPTPQRTKALAAFVKYLKELEAIG